MINNTIMFYHDIWKATSHNLNFCWRGLPASTVFHVCPLSNYTFICKHDPQDHKVLWWFMKGYQPYSTFVEEGFQPQQSFMFAHLQVIHSYVNMIHITIMFLCDLGRAPSHIQHLLKRASCLNTHSRSLMWFLSHCGILLKQLIVSVMTKYWIPWLSRKTHLKYTTKQQKTNKTFKGRVEWVGQNNALRTPCCSLRSRNEKGR